MFANGCLLPYAAVGESIFSPASNRPAPFTPTSRLFSPSKPSTTPTASTTNQKSAQEASADQPTASTTTPFVDSPATSDQMDIDHDVNVDSSPDKADTEDTPQRPRRYASAASIARRDKDTGPFNSHVYGNGKLLLPQTPGRGAVPRSTKNPIDRIHKRRRQAFGMAYEPYHPASSIPHRRQRLNWDDHGRERLRGVRPGSRGSDTDRSPHSSAALQDKESTQQPQQEQQQHQLTKNPTNQGILMPAEPAQSMLAQTFTFLESHPTIPRILSYYAQFSFNLILTILLLYVVVSFLLAIRSDVNRASEEVSADILAEMAVCARNYVENRCAESNGVGGRRLPALEAVCDRWDRCMNRDPAKVGRAKVSAQTLAEIFNGFIEPISFKAMPQHQQPAPPNPSMTPFHPAAHPGVMPFATPAHQIYDVAGYYGYPPPTHAQTTGRHAGVDMQHWGWPGPEMSAVNRRAGKETRGDSDKQLLLK
ncbi:hypothetical protein KEM55_003970 [Ascosphaera atra]|nr:hypothetical protein KEM55_003970 [Ascosphaera atra]